jgi:glycosyltransferase involved in cell wall biosynthesis
MSTRKGVEMIVDLTHRLDDLADQVQIQLVGDKSLWSDYRKHLTGLNPRVSCYLGPLPASQMATLFSNADALLVPSHYEPGSLVVGEALASGLPVVASDAVGPSEVLDQLCCRVFPAGDKTQFEAAVRGLLGDLRESWEQLSGLASSEAERFDPTHVGQQLRDMLITMANAGTTRGARTTSAP